MAVSKCKGTVLKATVSSVLTTVAQLVTLKPPGWGSEGFENLTLDQSGTGKGRDLTGYVESKDWDGELFWDPDLAVHQALLAFVTPTPSKVIMQVVFVNVGASVLEWTNAEMELSPTVAAGDGLKAKIGGKVDGISTLTV